MLTTRSVSLPFITPSGCDQSSEPGATLGQILIVCCWAAAPKVSRSMAPAVRNVCLVRMVFFAPLLFCGLRSPYYLADRHAALFACEMAKKEMLAGGRAWTPALGYCACA